MIADDGAVYVGDGARVACLWALADYRGMAERISSPRLLPTARRFIAAASAVRQSTRTPTSGRPHSGALDPSAPDPGAPETRDPHGGLDADYGDECDERCR